MTIDEGRRLEWLAPVETRPAVGHTKTRAKTVVNPEPGEEEKEQSATGLALRVVGWAMALILTSLVLPALTRQWADRPKELELKGNLTSRVSDVVATVVMTEGLATSNLLPEAVALRDVRTRFDKLTDEGQKRDAQRAVDAATAADIAAKQEVHNKNRERTERELGIIESEVAAYFSGGALEEKVRALRIALSQYITLGSGVCGESRDRTAKEIQGYLAQNAPRGTAQLRRAYDDEKMWAAVGVWDCDKRRASNFAFYYSLLGDRMVDGGKAIVRTTIASNPTGYSTGWRDFLSDIWPL